jgi:Putative Actinobacterial Holin-X, holin superfamily III
MAEPNGSTQPAVGPDASAGELVKNLTEQVSRLIRDELKLAEFEMTSKAKIGLASVLPAWAAALIVGGALLVVAGVAALMGKSQVSKAAPPVPEQTVQSVKADVEEVKERAHR